MVLPKPADSGGTKSESTSDPDPDPAPVRDGEPTFPDDMTHAELKEAIRVYQNWCAQNYDALNIDLDGIPVELSDKMKKTAGKVCHVRGTDTVKYIRYAWKAYQKWGWEQFAETIRHELIHVHTVQNHKRGGHGHRFKRLVNPLETHRHCETFAEDDAKYILLCKECEGIVAYRYRRSATVKNPEKYRSNCCNSPLKVTGNR